MTMDTWSCIKINKFWRKVDRTGGCWIWTAGHTAKGYGNLHIDKKTWRAHRFAWTLLVGEIPAGMQLDHRVTCPKDCVNPAHLRLVTNKQNQENRSTRSRINTSGARGVSWSSRDKRWVVRVKHNYHQYSGGNFLDLEEAITAAVSLRNSLMTHNDADRIAA